VQYSRAIRAYYKKFGRYPTRVEELESTNNLRFLRKRYKDPITGKDFKLLHFGEVKLTMSGGIGGGGINGATSLNPSSGGLGAQPGGLGGGSSFGSSPGGLGASANNGTATPNSTTTPDPNQDPSQASSGQPGPSSSTDKLAGQTFGGGPIVGVLSSAVANSKKDESIREFNHKKKYSEWQFIYDPATDRGGLLNTPNQPPLQGFGTQPGMPLQPGSSTDTTNGPIPGMQNNPNLMGPGGPGTPTPPPPPEQPQQQ
jgi:hypothetical protein